MLIQQILNRMSHNRNRVFCTKLFGKAQYFPIFYVSLPPFFCFRVKWKYIFTYVSPLLFACFNNPKWSDFLSVLPYLDKAASLYSSQERSNIDNFYAYLCVCVCIFLWGFNFFCTFPYLFNILFHVFLFWNW